MGSAALRPGPGSRLSPLALAGALFALAAVAWLVTGERMRGMDAAPGIDLGGFGWFAVSWVVMMTAMMVPSLAPAALVFARGRGRRAAGFVLGYLAVWTAAGLASYALLGALRSIEPDVLAWDRAGRFIAAGVILAAAGYQLTGVKARCLERCRAPLAANLGAAGALRGGFRHGASCLGCCIGLMAALFALGVMSLTWMVAVAVLIAAERLLPWEAPALYAVAATLIVLAIWVAVAPAHLPGFTVPGSMAGGM